MLQAGWQVKLNPIRTLSTRILWRTQVFNAKLTNATETRIWRKLLRRSSYASKFVPAEAEPWESHENSLDYDQHSKPLFIPKKSYSSSNSQPRSPIPRWHPLGPQGLSRCQTPQVRTLTQLSRVGSQGLGIRSTALRRENSKKNLNDLPPCVSHSTPNGAPLLNKGKKMHFFPENNSNLNFWAARPTIFCVLQVRVHKDTSFDLSLLSWRDAFR